MIRAAGSGSWSVDEIVSYLKTGHNRTSAATGLMAETLTLSTSKMSDPDLKAIAAYLKDQPGDAADQPGEAQSAPATPDQATMKIGAQIYADECSGCHTANGNGVAGLFPRSAERRPCNKAIRPRSSMWCCAARSASAPNRHRPVPRCRRSAWVLNDDQVAAVVTYIRNAWGNAAPAVSASDVGKTREALVERSD